MCTLRNFSGQLSWIGRLLFPASPLTANSPHKANQSHHVICFVADKFVIYDDANERSLPFEAGVCGGGHRCRDALLSQSRNLRAQDPSTANNPLTMQAKVAESTTAVGDNERGLSGGSNGSDVMTQSLLLTLTTKQSLTLLTSKKGASSGSQRKCKQYKQQPKRGKVKQQCH